MRYLICGGRDFGLNDEEQDFIYKTLNKFMLTDDFIISGAARGVDTVAINYAKSHRVEYKEFPANWSKYGNSAGPIRNKQMLMEGNPDWVIAFPGGVGTLNMITLAKRSKVKVKIYDY